MTISGTPVSTNLYSTVAALKSRLGITDTTDDTILTSILTGVCRAIDKHTGRWFWRDATATTRYYTPKWTDLIYTDPIVSVTNLYTDTAGDWTWTTTWAATDYALMPYNASNDGWPYEYIQTTPNGNYSFSVLDKYVKIVGIFGWPSVPYEVTEAALLWSERLYKRKDAPFGIMASIETGELRFLKEMDPDVTTLLEPYRVLAFYL
jgi:hypothetical protein